MIICLIILCIMLAVIISANIKIVPQAHSYIIERFTVSHFPVIEQTVTNQLLSLIRQDRTVQQFSLFAECIIEASLRIDVIIVTHDIRRTENGSNLGKGIILQCIRCQDKLGIHQFHIMIEYRLFGSRAVFSPVRGQYILFIHQSPSLEVIPEIIKTVIIQTIGQKRRVPVNHFYVLTNLRNLCHSVVIKIITVDEQSVSLFHTHITEGLHRVGFLKNQRTVTIHIHTVVTQLYISNQYLNIRSGKLVGLSLVCMKQIYFRLLIFGLFLDIFTSLLRSIQSFRSRSLSLFSLPGGLHLRHKAYGKQA